MSENEHDPGVVYVVHGPKGFTETFNLHTINVLLRLGLIEHERDGRVLEDGRGNGVGPLHRFYCEAGRRSVQSERIGA